MFCKSCGAKIDDDSRFCRECGYKIVYNKENSIDKDYTGTRVEYENNSELKIKEDKQNKEISIDEKNVYENSVIDANKSSSTNNKKIKDGTIVLICFIASIIFISVPILALIIPVIGFVFAIKGYNEKKNILIFISIIFFILAGFVGLAITSGSCGSTNKSNNSSTEITSTNPEIFDKSEVDEIIFDEKNGIATIYGETYALYSVDDIVERHNENGARCDKELTENIFAIVGKVEEMYQTTDYDLGDCYTIIIQSYGKTAYGRYDTFSLMLDLSFEDAIIQLNSGDEIIAVGTCEKEMNWSTLPYVMHVDNFWY